MSFYLGFFKIKEQALILYNLCFKMYFILIQPNLLSMYYVPDSFSL